VRIGTYPPGCELVGRELYRATFAAGADEELGVAARQAIRHVRSLMASLGDDRRALLDALDARCAADQLVRMVGVARTGVGRGVR
jgi:hypothetical protein